MKQEELEKTDKDNEITFLTGEASSLLERATELARAAGRTRDRTLLREASTAARRAADRIAQAQSLAEKAQFPDQ